MKSIRCSVLFLVLVLGLGLSFTAAAVAQAYDRPTFTGSRTGSAALKAQAMKYKKAIGNAQHYSEGDDSWLPFVSMTTVDENFSQRQVKQALRSGRFPVETWSAKDTIDFIEDYIVDTYSAEEARAYRRLKEALLEDFNVTDLRMFKVGYPDSGMLDLYIVGRTPEGYLVGLRTTTVET